MRRLSMAAAALAATAFCSPSPASAEACVQDEYGRVLCDAAPYPGGWSYLWPPCPPGTVAGNYQCVAWRLPRGAKCPQPNMRVVDGFCRRYSDY